MKTHGETSFRQELRLTVRFILFPVIQGASNGGKALQAGDDHIVGSAGTVDDQQIAVFIPATHNTNMSIFWIAINAPLLSRPVCQAKKKPAVMDR